MDIRKEVLLPAAWQAFMGVKRQSREETPAEKELKHLIQH